jgi:hypothetical protein
MRDQVHHSSSVGSERYVSEEIERGKSRKALIPKIRMGIGLGFFTPDRAGLAGLGPSDNNIAQSMKMTWA